MKIEEKMKIALVGTHNSGKTTLFNLMKKDKMFKDYYFVGELIRELNEKGFGINENAKDDTQLALALLNYYYSTKKDYDTRIGKVIDRCLLDNYIYAKYLFNKGIVSKKVVDLIEPLVNESLYYFDFIFLCTPEFEMEYDGQRNNDKNFQMEIHQMFLDYIKHDIDCEHKVKILKGGSKERLEIVKQFIYTAEMGW